MPTQEEIAAQLPAIREARMQEKIEQTTIGNEHGDSRIFVPKTYKFTRSVDLSSYG